MSDGLELIIADMQRASDVVDEAYGTSGYQAALVALGLIARHFLREHAKAAQPDPPEGTRE